MSDAFSTLLMTAPMYESARPVLKTVPEVLPGKSDPGALAGAIELSHIAFRYSEDGPLILRDISLEINPGEFIAFVGPSGSGKSTIFRLLLGFETPESGTIYYDRQDQAGLDITALRQQVGVVLQNGKLLPGDIFTNIIGSSTTLTLEDAWEAARMAGFAEDIESMPMGMHTVVSEGGGTLSGGQRQRLMIARAIVNRPKMMFMDEATSALDNRTQEIVSKSLENLKATRIVIAHRLSTVVNADKIAVIEGGYVQELGTYDELMALDGKFANLAKRQLA
jgi:ATP-binding cassette subfamily C protein